MGQDTSDQPLYNEGRPDPEELLTRYELHDSDLLPELADEGDEAVSRQDHRLHKHGRLRVYLASAAGAGKTYAMLSEGRRRKNRDTDVVVGYVETHRRPQTEAQLGDLAVIPRKKITYREVTLEEMDTEAIL